MPALRTASSMASTAPSSGRSSRWLRSSTTAARENIWGAARTRRSSSSHGEATPTGIGSIDRSRAFGQPRDIGQAAMHEPGVAHIAVAGQVLGEQADLRAIRAHLLLVDLLETVGAVEQHH